ncbi:hypothetical protein BU23DRAFT_255153 [Bimuria novae-zelandiae CBS 107.79]|uniref:Uncharacterized protein n=1 Tax=Bimuria novae-zelandiae CBS 107.79 TaxID=1447943 RepID=A0A6A5UWT5_9PLEO|nr:hypothetical protein BU23DRAFT_255153 [Bimuria novae-zelandiae CBS 107.79]
MRSRQILGRALHALLVLTLSYLLLHVLYWGFTLLAEDARQEHAAQHPVSNVENIEDVGNDKPTPQQIAESLNTVWLSYDLDHCRNVCEASRVACRLRDCWQVPGVKTWD